MLNFFALLEARLLQARRREAAAYFFADRAWQAYVKAYAGKRTEDYLFAIVMLHRASVLIPDSEISLDPEQALAGLAINAGNYPRLIASLETLKQGVAGIGVDVSGVNTYRQILQLVIADMVSDLGASGVTPTQLAESDLRDVYDVALFVHKDSLAS